MAPTKRTRNIITVLLVAVLLAGVVSASNASSFSITDLGLTGPQTVQVFTINSTGGYLAGTYNSTANGIPVPDSDFTIVLKPETKENWFNPPTMLEDIMAKFKEHWQAILLLAVVAGILGYFWRR